MFRFNRIAAAAFAAGTLTLAGAAMAQESYPRIVGSGENATVVYGPAGSATVVGGGPVTVTTEPNGSLTFRYADDSRAQQGLRGVEAVDIDTGENAGSAWVPVGSLGTTSPTQG